MKFLTNIFLHTSVISPLMTNIFFRNVFSQNSQSTFFSSGKTSSFIFIQSNRHLQCFIFQVFVSLGRRRKEKIPK
jgi:hypothetical protein